MSVLRQMQDHAAALCESAKLVSATQAKHKEVTALTHRICSQMHDNAQLQSTQLETCQDDIAKLQKDRATRAT